MHKIFTKLKCLITSCKHQAQTQRLCISKTRNLKTCSTRKTKVRMDTCHHNGKYMQLWNHWSKRISGHPSYLHFSFIRAFFYYTDRNLYCTSRPSRRPNIWFLVFLLDMSPTGEAHNSASYSPTRQIPKYCQRPNSAYGNGMHKEDCPEAATPILSHPHKR